MSKIYLEGVNGVLGQIKGFSISSEEFEEIDILSKGFKKGDEVIFINDPQGKKHIVKKSEYLHSPEDKTMCVDLFNYPGEVGVNFLSKKKYPKVYMVNQKHGVAAESPEEALQWYKDCWVYEKTYVLKHVKPLHLNNLQQALECMYEKPFLAVGEF